MKTIVKILISILLDLEWHERRSFYIMVLFIIVFAAIDAIFILILAPLITSILNGSFLELLQYIEEISGIDLTVSQVLYSVLILVVITSVGRLYSIYYPIKIVQSFRSQLSRKLAIRFLNMSRYDPNAIGIDKFIKLVTSEVDQSMSSVVQPMVNVIVSIIFIVVTLSVVISYDPLPTIVAFFVITLIYVFLRLIQRKIQKVWGKDRLMLNGIRYKLVNNLFINNINILLAFKEHEIYSKLNFTVDQYSTTLAKNYALNRFPKILIESIILFAFLATSIFLSQNSDENYLNSLLIYFLIAYRMLPHFQSINQNIGEQTFGLSSIEAILRETSRYQPILHNGSKDKMFIKRIEVGDICIPFIANNNKISFELKLGQLNILQGSSGIGKTALIERLIGLHGNEIGKINFFSENGVCTNLKISYMPQSNYIDKDITPNQYFANELTGKEFRDCKEFAKKLLINEKLDDKIGKLSGGQLQRVILAKTLSVDADLIILDEPTSALDEHASYLVFEILENIKSRKIGLIISHDSNLMDFDPNIINIG